MLHAIIEVSKVWIPAAAVALVAAWITFRKVRAARQLDRIRQAGYAAFDRYHGTRGRNARGDEAA